MSDLQFLNDVRSTVITAIFADDTLRPLLAVKGGSAMDLLYNRSHRASLDVDFSMGRESPPLDVLSDRLKRALVEAFAERKLDIIDFDCSEVPAEMDDDLRSFWGGYRVVFKLVQRQTTSLIGSLETRRRNAIKLLGPQSSPTFVIDISRYEDISRRQEVEFQGYSVFVYTPEMIVAEKLRALCQQTDEYCEILKRKSRRGSPRGRDFLDIYVACEELGVDFSDAEFQNTVREMFEAKRVPLHLIAAIGAYRDLHALDFAKIKDTLHKATEPFEFYFEYLLTKSHVLKPLWESDAPV